MRCAAERAGEENLPRAGTPTTLLRNVAGDPKPSLLWLLGAGLRGQSPKAKEG